MLSRMGLGTGELIVIVLIAAVLFGANKLPALGDGLGKAIRGFKKAVNTVEDDAKSVVSDVTEAGKDAQTKPPAPPAAKP
jgi:sec-independent protein translocase protein TatA